MKNRCRRCGLTSECGADETIRPGFMPCRLLLMQFIVIPLPALT